MSLSLSRRPANVRIISTPRSKAANRLSPVGSTDAAKPRKNNELAVSSISFRTFRCRFPTRADNLPAASFRGFAAIDSNAAEARCCSFPASSVVRSAAFAERSLADSSEGGIRCARDTASLKRNSNSFPFSIFAASGIIPSKLKLSHHNRGTLASFAGRWSMNQCNQTGCQNLRVRDWHRMAEIVAWRSHRRGAQGVAGPKPPA